MQASGIYTNATQSNFNPMNMEFGSETNFNEVKQQNMQAEAKKQQTSGIFANRNKNN